MSEETWRDAVSAKVLVRCLPIPTDTERFRADEACGLIDTITSAVTALTAERDRFRHDYEFACAMVAQMHAAAVGSVRGPIRGIVDDVADLKAERDRLAAATTAYAACIGTIRGLLGLPAEDIRPEHVERYSREVAAVNAQLVEALEQINTAVYAEVRPMAPEVRPRLLMGVLNISRAALADAGKGNL